MAETEAEAAGQARPDADDKGKGVAVEETHAGQQQQQPEDGGGEREELEEKEELDDEELPEFAHEEVAALIEVGGLYKLKAADP
jgi:hypothetical protein